ncbi:MAG: hypothetical protein PQJ60_06580, partial [Spirochaetales bacterium]|nr:hypothetical protein [Spirochaetales bacterium]
MSGSGSLTYEYTKTWDTNDEADESFVRVYTVINVSSYALSGYEISSYESDVTVVYTYVYDEYYIYDDNGEYISSEYEESSSYSASGTISLDGVDYLMEDYLTYAMSLEEEE